MRGENQRRSFLLLYTELGTNAGQRQRLAIKRTTFPRPFFFKK